MKWGFAAAALVVVANGIVLVSAGRERAAPGTLTAIDVCATHLIGGGNSDDPPALRLTIAPDSLATPGGLDPAGLRALGFAEAAIAAVGTGRDSTLRSPRARPAWVRLRQQDDSLRRFAVTEVAPRREGLAPDSLSLIVRGRVAFRQRPVVPPPGPGAEHHPAGVSARVVVYPAVIEVIPAQLHLDRRQIAELRNALPGSAGCGATRQAMIAHGARGGIWVEALR
jgi:hypothetical protein